MNKTVKTIVDEIDKVKSLCDNIKMIIDIFQYNSTKCDSCNSVEYKQLKQDIRANTKQIDNILEELNTKVFDYQLEKLKQTVDK